MPLFVAITPSMKVEFPGEGEWDGESDERLESAQMEVTRPPRR
jgi:hypothetical protein